MRSSDREATHPPGALSSAEVGLRALDVLEVVLATADQAEAMINGQSMLEGLDELTLRRVAAYLAGLTVQAFSRRPGKLTVQQFIEWRRLEFAAQLPGAGQ